MKHIAIDLINTANIEELEYILKCADNKNKESMSIDAAIKIAEIVYDELEGSGIDIDEKSIDKIAQISFLLFKNSSETTRDVSETINKLVRLILFEKFQNELPICKNKLNAIIDNQITKVEFRKQIEGDIQKFSQFDILESIKTQEDLDSLLQSFVSFKDKYPQFKFGYKIPSEKQIENQSELLKKVWQAKDVANKKRKNASTKQMNLEDEIEQMEIGLASKAVFIRQRGEKEIGKPKFISTDGVTTDKTPTIDNELVKDDVIKESAEQDFGSSRVEDPSGVYTKNLQGSGITDQNALNAVLTKKVDLYDSDSIKRLVEDIASMQQEQKRQIDENRVIETIDEIFNLSKRLRELNAMIWHDKMVTRQISDSTREPLLIREINNFDRLSDRNKNTIKNNLKSMERESLKIETKLNSIENIIKKSNLNITIKEIMMGSANFQQSVMKKMFGDSDAKLTRLKNQYAKAVNIHDHYKYLSNCFRDDPSNEYKDLAVISRAISYNDSKQR
jgi:hypothetical protein